MKTSAQVENLWNYIQSLSLSKRNRQWLADRLIDNTENIEEPEEEYISKEEILAGIDAGLKDLKAGRVRPIEELFKELKNAN